MAANAARMDTVAFLQDQNVPFLKRYLQDRSVSVGTKRKEELLALCVRAHTIGLQQECLGDNDAQHGELARMAAGQTLPHQSALQSPWVADMRGLPRTSLIDVFNYLRIKAGWSTDRLRRYQDDRGYLLHQSGPVTDMKLNIHESYAYVRGLCTPQTWLSARPYDLWILLAEDGEIITGECTCTA